MANANTSTASSALQAANGAFVDSSDLLRGADALVTMHKDADGKTLLAVHDIIRLLRNAAECSQQSCGPSGYGLRLVLLERERRGAGVTLYRNG